MRLPIVVGAPPGARAGAVADLLTRDHDVLRTADVASALRECRRLHALAAVLPFPGGADAEVLGFLREPFRRTAVFLCAEAGPAPPGAAAQALAAGAGGVLDAAAADFADELSRRIGLLARERRRQAEEDRALAALFARFDLAGASPAMRDVFRRALKASQLADLPVLIEGERGTPRRRLVSAVLHLDPTRARTPFFALDGRDAARGLGAGGDAWQGLLRAGRGGTVFLDHVEALGREGQRALAAAAFRRPPGLRLIAAAGRPAEDLVRQGLLDAELSMALSLFRIPLPPLRGRPEDVAAQAHHALGAAAAEGASPVKGFDPGVLAHLGRLPWEGNTAELEAVLRAALAGARGPALRPDDLPRWVRDWPADAPPPRPVPHPGDCADAAPATGAAAEYERRALRAVLSRQADAGPVRPDHEVG